MEIRIANFGSNPALSAIFYLTFRWYKKWRDRDRLRKAIEGLVEIAGSQNHAAIAAKIKELIPEYAGNNNS